MNEIRDNETPEFVRISVIDEPPSPSSKTPPSLGKTSKLPSYGIDIEDKLRRQRLQDKGCTKA